MTISCSLNNHCEYNNSKYIDYCYFPSLFWNHFIVISYIFSCLQKYIMLIETALKLHQFWKYCILIILVLPTWEHEMVFTFSDILSDFLFQSTVDFVVAVFHFLGEFNWVLMLSIMISLFYFLLHCWCTEMVPIYVHWFCILLYCWI